MAIVNLFAMAISTVEMFTIFCYNIKNQIAEAENERRKTEGYAG